MGRFCGVMAMSRRQAFWFVASLGALAGASRDRTKKEDGGDGNGDVIDAADTDPDGAAPPTPLPGMRSRKTKPAFRGPTSDIAASRTAESRTAESCTAESRGSDADAVTPSDIGRWARAGVTVGLVGCASTRARFELFFRFPKLALSGS